MTMCEQKTVANRNKMSMFTYGAHEDEWKKLIDLAAAQGYTKFWVTDDGNHTKKDPDDMAGYSLSLSCILKIPIECLER